MNSLRRKRAYGAVMVIAAAALAVDRCALSNEPAAAFSAHGDIAHGDASEPVDRHSPYLEALPAVSIPELPFPRGVAALDLPASNSPCRDLFAPPESVVNRNTPDASTDSNDSSMNRDKHTERVNCATFLTHHRLSGVLLFESLRIAVVDGIWLRKGQLLDACTLISVSGNEARFECHDGQAVLRVTNAKSLTRG